MLSFLFLWYTILIVVVLSSAVVATTAASTSISTSTTPTFHHHHHHAAAVSGLATISHHHQFTMYTRIQSSSVQRRIISATIPIPRNVMSSNRVPLSSVVEKSIVGKSLSIMFRSSSSSSSSSLSSYHHYKNNNKMAFALVGNNRNNMNNNKLTTATRRAAFFNLSNSRSSCSHHSQIICRTRSCLLSNALSSSSSDNYYNAATSMSTLSTTSPSSSSSKDDGTFPKWWPTDNADTDYAADTSLQKHISFADHIAHVIVPNIDTSESDSTTTTTTALTCEEVVQWVLHLAKARNNPKMQQQTSNSNSSNSLHTSIHSAIFREGSNIYHDTRQSRIQIEWTQGEETEATVSNDVLPSSSIKVLDPAYRHDPSYFPQTTTSNDNGDDDADATPIIQPNLIASELLALGSVWYLPQSSTPKSTTNGKSIDRFDPSCGIKPIRLNVGDANKTASVGDYFRVHFDPRRFVDANLYDWGMEDGVVKVEGDSDGKPGVIVKRDDEAGYVIVNKPPNIPVHARVDNSLENVASRIGGSLWVEFQKRKGEEEESMLLSSEEDDGKEDALLMDAANGTANVTNVSNDVIAERIRISRERKMKNRKQKVEPLIYVATPQRLDQNTSGLLVVATKKSFAAYFAKLLRTKTSGQLKSNNDDDDASSSSSSESSRSSSCGIHKSYRCLVCIAPPSHDNEHKREGDAIPATIASMASEINRLKQYTNTIMKHFLEPSIRSPKRFVPTIPEDVLAVDGDDKASSWAECLLRITNVREVCTVVGNDPSRGLARDLWGDYGKPEGCVAVAECEIELLTGRTHQIRGQLAAEGFPLVGDVQYGGAVPNTSSLYKERCKGRAESFLDSECLALQCRKLEFLDPHHVVPKTDGSSLVADKDKKAIRSERWNSFTLDRAFWTPFVDRYHTESAKMSSSEATSSLAVEEALLLQTKLEPRSVDASTTREVPPKVLLSQGSNKYVVIRAVFPNGSDDDDHDKDEQWFVRSASPEECGGPYHANVAETLLQQLRSLGFTATVMGGGRIDFMKSDEVSHAHVFGFSYGFGKGDHEKVASIIEQCTDVVATFDSSDGLY